MRKILKTETEIMTYDELSPAAQARARDWYRENGLDYDWYDGVYEDAKAIAARMGITISQIYFSGFSSQGDGACFECTFEGKEGGAALVKDYAPQDKELHEIADAWEALQKSQGYKLTGGTKHQGAYNHAQCTRVWAEREAQNDNEESYSFDTDDSYVRDNEEPGAQAARILRRLMKWVYSQLEKQYDYITSDEAIAETILANEYTFTADGKREG